MPIKSVSDGSLKISRLDLRQVIVTSFDISMDHLQNEIEMEINFIAKKIVVDNMTKAINSGKGCDLTYRLDYANDEDDVIQEVIAKDSFITGYSCDTIPNVKNTYNVKLEFMSSNAGLRYLYVLKSKDGKEMIVNKEIAKLVKKNCTPKDISYGELEKIVLSCMI